MSELINIPSFVFYPEYEPAIHVKYYNGSIELSQREDSIIIDSNELEKLFKEIKKHSQKAKEYLEKR